VTLLDAYALVAFLIGGPSSATVRGLLREGDTAVTTANLAETLDVAERRYAIPVLRSMEFLDPLLDGPLTTLALDVRIAVRAATIRSQHYDRAKRDLSIGDSILIASAGPADRIVTADAAVLAVAGRLQLATVALADKG
jgi:predicted nucleic acid-binding protein